MAKQALASPALACDIFLHVTCRTLVSRIGFTILMGAVRLCVQVASSSYIRVKLNCACCHYKGFRRKQFTVLGSLLRISVRTWVGLSALGSGRHCFLVLGWIGCRSGCLLVLVCFLLPALDGLSAVVGSVGLPASPGQWDSCIIMSRPWSYAYQDTPVGLSLVW